LTIAAGIRDDDPKVSDSELSDGRLRRNGGFEQQHASAPKQRRSQEVAGAAARGAGPEQRTSRLGRRNHFGLLPTSNATTTLPDESDSGNCSPSLAKTKYSPELTTT
jgi:hypothetical protein